MKKAAECPDPVGGLAAIAKLSLELAEVKPEYGEQLKEDFWSAAESLARARPGVGVQLNDQIGDMLY